MASCTFQEDGRGVGGGVSIGCGSLSLKEQHSSSDQVLDPSLKMSAEKSLKYKQNSGRHEKLIFVHLNFQQEAEQSHILHSS